MNNSVGISCMTFKQLLVLKLYYIDEHIQTCSHTVFKNNVTDRQQIKNKLPSTSMYTRGM